jgi:predicted RND superfamily exporter protein
MDGALAETVYRTAALAELLEMDEDIPVKLYLLNLRRHGDTSAWRISVRDMIRFINEEVLTDEDLAGRISAADADRLDAASRLTEAVVAGEGFGVGDMTRLFEGMWEDLSENRMRLLYLYYFSRMDSDPAWTLSLLDLFHFLADDVLSDPLFADVFEDETADQILEAKAEIDDGAVQLQGPHFSRLIIETDYPVDSPETYAFIDSLLAEFGEDLQGSYYLIGDSSMRYELSTTFGDEQTFLTLLTAATIFVVVAVTFRSLLIPALLVLLIQCGVYLTVCLIGLQGYSIFFLALLVVQSILMGATIDYAILFTNYYLEYRRSQGPQEALVSAYNGAIHTILTSGLIMILATGVLGLLFENPTVGEICQTISRGALCASLLIVFVLPGVLSICDRWICEKNPGV